MLAITQSDPRSVRAVFLWCGILVVLLLIAFAGYSYLKRWMKQADEPGSVGFTLSDLREMHRQGKMSDAEFELTKAKMLGSAKQMTEKLPPVFPRRAARPPVDPGISGPPAE